MKSAFCRGRRPREVMIDLQPDEYKVNLEVFEGPLDLLLYLIRKDEVDIYDIPIARIADEYTAYLRVLKLLDLNLAGEFLVMAATLSYIKSRMLLPAEERPGEETDEADEGQDPRWDLVRQLLEYKRFKEAAEGLLERERQQQNRFGPSGTPLISADDLKGEKKLADVSLADLVDVHVEDGTLHVGIKKGCQVRYKKMDIYVTSPTLEAVAVVGSGTMVLTGRLETDALGMSVSGSGDLVGEEVVCKGDVWLSVAGSGDLSVGKVSCRQMEASVSGSGDLAVKEVIAGKAAASVAGSGDLVLSGKAVEADFRVAGSGDLDASCLKAEQAAASVAGSGDLKCYASDCLKARVAGSGSIGYAGNPKGLDISRKNVYPL